MNKIEKLIGKRNFEKKGEIVLLLRKSLNISRAELRRLYNENFSDEKSYMTVWRFETGRTSNPNPKMFFGMLQVLGITADEFYEYVDENNIMFR
jgi:hypothetical protein